MGKQLPSTPGPPRSPMTPLVSNRLHGNDFDTAAGARARFSALFRRYLHKQDCCEQSGLL